MWFKADSLEKILKGEKTMTRRVPGVRSCEVGRVYRVRYGWSEKVKYHILITRKFQEKLGAISLEDVHKEGYGSLEEFKAAWIKLYGSWKPEQTVTVYEFKLVEGI